MDILFWLKFLHRFFVTTGFIALFAIMCSADTRFDADAGNSLSTPSVLADQCERRNWVDDLLSLPNTKNILLCDELDKVTTQNTVSNK